MYYNLLYVLLNITENAPTADNIIANFSQGVDKLFDIKFACKEMPPVKDKKIDAKLVWFPNIDSIGTPTVIKTLPCYDLSNNVLDLELAPSDSKKLIADHFILPFKLTPDKCSNFIIQLIEVDSSVLFKGVFVKTILQQRWEEVGEKKLSLRESKGE